MSILWFLISRSFSNVKNEIIRAVIVARLEYH